MNSSSNKPVCYYHPDKVSFKTCDNCHKPVCRDDLKRILIRKAIFLVIHLDYCIPCKSDYVITEQQKYSSPQRRNITIIASVGIFITGIIIFFVFQPVFTGQNLIFLYLLVLGFFIFSFLNYYSLYFLQYRSSKVAQKFEVIKEQFLSTKGSYPRQ